MPIAEKLENEGGDAGTVKGPEKNRKEHETILIPVASGKGGVGKSFLTANIGLAMANLGSRVVVADLDLGGSNLHSYLGISAAPPGIGDFIQEKSTNIEEYVVPTDYSNLRLLAGSGSIPFMENITHAEKKKVGRALKQIKADYVLLDLSSGSDFNTLDYFSLSSRGILVSTPELPSILNALSFMKLYLLRRWEKNLESGRRIRSVIRDSFSRRNDTLSMRELIPLLERENPDAGGVLESLLRNLRIRMVFNQATRMDHLKVIDRCQRVIHKILGIGVDFMGFVFHDEEASRALEKRLPFLALQNQSPAAGEITQIARRIRTRWQSPIPDSAARLAKSIHTLFQAGNSRPKG